jgi:hypothetical protein
MKHKVNFIIFLLFISINSFTQEKQGNTNAADIFADAPYRMLLQDNSANIQPIPVHIMVFDGDELGAAVDLMSIDIYIKNASDTEFGDILVFDTISDAQFEEMLIHRSVYDEVLDVQDFNNSEYSKSPEHSIIFTESSGTFSSNEFVKINQNVWHFTFLIPPSVLENYEPIVDIKVYFNIDWATDDESYLRVFRYNEELPKLSNWYRGDTHYHTIFTQNLAEVGESLEATKYAGQKIGLDWQFATDHSCDYDNYGNNIEENWDILGDKIHELNTEDDSYIFIRGVEMSVTNSDDRVIHALTYPTASSIQSLGFYGDGKGDASATDVSSNELLDSLVENQGMCYAAHPFAEGDKLPDLISGGIWNLGDDTFLLNDEPYENTGTVICNDPSLPSDVFSDNPNYLLKPGLIGFQIWNLDSRLTTGDGDNFYDAWNISGNGSELSPLDISENYNMINRLNQGFEVYLHIIRRGLIEKTLNAGLENWKAFMCAGSDAHGSFNFSNTDMIMGYSGDIEINALGRISTLAFCPEGMGNHGENILNAFQNGNLILSDGPIISMHLSDGSGDNIIIGSDSVINQQQLQNLQLVYHIVTTEEFGDVTNAQLMIGTSETEYSYPLSVDEGEYNINLESILNSVFNDEIPEDEYIYIRAELLTLKNFDSNADLYKRESENYQAFTNPIWLNIESPNSIESLNNNQIRTLKSDSELRIEFYSEGNSELYLEIYNALGQRVFYEKLNKSAGIQHFTLPRAELSAGLHIVTIHDANRVYSTKLMN